ncbi:MAG: pilus assembly protein PilP [Proteobacteria bacterium]|nr:pilus assembly protein PilP [Pseudomonadota bacterium]
MKENRALIISLIITFLMFYACKKETTETPQAPSAPKKQAFSGTTSKSLSSPTFQNLSAKIASMPKYSFSGVKDPFYTILLQTPTKDKKITQIKGKPQATQKYEIDKYKLIGIMLRKQGSSAIFEDPEGKGWVLKEGSFIGNEGARIKKIQQDSVIIEEPVGDHLGNVKYVERSISIKKVP